MCLILANFLSTTFYDFKVKFGYIGESPENTHRKYEYFENKYCIFWSKHGFFTASLDILNIKRLISPPEREGFEAQILAGLYWDYICPIGM